MNRAAIPFIGLVALVVAVGAQQTARSTQAKETVYRPGPGRSVRVPTLVKEVKPHYTPAAMQEQIEGVVLMEAVVLRDGRVGDVRVVKSLDAKFGLDREAVKAAKQWRFKPGTLKGAPVAVLVTLEMAFTLPAP
jgi:TonB family protein